MTTLTKCQWCQAEFPVELTSCPRCGGSADISKIVDDGGWVELPPIKDMAEIQIGQSRAQIEGLMVPVVDIDLADGDVVFAHHHKMLWYDGKTQLKTKKTGMFKAMKTGMPMTLMLAEGPGRVAFSDNHPGELVPLPMDGVTPLNARHHHLLVATGNVEYDDWTVPIWYETEETRTTSEGTETETEMHYPMDDFAEFKTTDGQPGLAIMHAIGNVFMRKLNPGEAIHIAPHSLLAWNGDPQQSLVIESRSWSRNNPKYISVRLEGPGTVWIQSGAIGKTQEHERMRRVADGSLLRDI